MSSHVELTTADLILQRAADLFRRKGYHATTMHDIGDAVGMEKASLYYHFRSKQAILERIIVKAMDVLVPHAEALVTSSIPADEKLKQMVQHHAEMLADHMDEIAVAILEHRDLPPDVRTKFMPMRDHYRKLITRVVSEGAQRGVWKADSPELVALAILGMCNWLVLWYRPDGPLSPSEIAQRFSNLVLNGLLER